MNKRQANKLRQQAKLSGLHGVQSDLVSADTRPAALAYQPSVLPAAADKIRVLPNGSKVTVKGIATADARFRGSYAIASYATRAYVADGVGVRRHSGIVDATGTTNLTSATRIAKSARSNSHSESKRSALDPRWGMTTAESNPDLWVKPTE
jgi:hypothetical protein